MTEYKTYITNGNYELTFTTDSIEYYRYMQECARNCIDGKYLKNANCCAEELIKNKDSNSMVDEKIRL